MPSTLRHAVYVSLAICWCATLALFQGPVKSVSQVQTRTPVTAPVALSKASWSMRWFQVPTPAPKPVEKPRAVSRPAPKVETILPRTALQAQVADLWPGDDATLFRVIACESHWNPRAVSPTGDHGLLQINARTWRDEWEGSWQLGPWNPNVYDVAKNLKAGWKIFSASGWGAWTCF